MTLYAIPLHLVRHAARAVTRRCPCHDRLALRYGVAALTGMDRCHFFDRRHGHALAGRAH